MASSFGRKRGQHPAVEISDDHLNLYEAVRGNTLNTGGWQESATAFCLELNSKQSYSLTSEEASEEEEERDLLASLAAGETDVFWQLWERHRRYLFAVCIRQTGGTREEAEEALSKAMMRALEKLPAQAGEITNLRFWLARLTHNVCIDDHRERKRRAAKVEQLNETEAEVAVINARAVETPEQATLRREKFVYMERIIGELPSRLRNPFLLRFLWLMSYHAIAEDLEITAENARKRVQQARVRLRKEMGDYFGESAGDSSRKSFPSPPVAAPLDPLLAVHLDINKGEAPRAIAMKGRPIHVMMASGAEMNFYIALNGELTRPRASIETLEKYVRDHPRGWRKRLDLAGQLYARGRWEDAVNEYRFVARRPVRLMETRLRIGAILRLMGKSSEARACYESALPLARRSASCHHLGGQIEICHRRYDIAAAEFTRAAFLEPEYVEHWNALGLTALCDELPERALQAFDSALEIDRDNLIALTHSYEPLILTGNLPEARRRVERVLIRNPNDALALTRLADLHIASGKVYGVQGKETRQLIRQVLRLAPRAAFTSASMVLYRIARGEFEEGIAYANAFAERHPAQPCGWYYSAYALWRGGEREAATNAIVTAAGLCRGEYALEDDEENRISSFSVWKEVEDYFTKMLRHFPESRCLWLKPVYTSLQA